MINSLFPSVPFVQILLFWLRELLPIEPRGRSLNERSLRGQKVDVPICSPVNHHLIAGYKGERIAGARRCSCQRAQVRKCPLSTTAG